MRAAALASILIVVASLSVESQVTPRDSAAAVPAITHLLRTAQGSTFLGRLLEDRPDSVRFETNGGVLTVARASISELRGVAPTDVHGGEYWFPNPGATRLFFAPTGRMLRAREGYYSNTYLFLNGLYTGLSDRVTIGGNFTLFPGSTEQLMFATPKIGVYVSEDLNVAVGGLLGYNAFGDTDDRNFGILYSVATVGSPDASATAGLGWGYSGSGLARTPAVMLGGSVRTSRRTALVTENYYVSTATTSATVFGYGIRFFGEKLAVDFAFINLADEPVFPGIPFVSFSVKF